MDPLVAVIPIIVQAYWVGLRTSIINYVMPSAKLKKITSQGYEKTMENVILSGVIGIDVVIAQAFITTASSEFLLRLSLFSFAIGIPFLAIGILLNQVIWKAGYQASSPINYNVTKIIGTLSSFVGMIATFWHIFWLIGVTFLISGFIGITICFIYIGSLEKEMHDKATKVVIKQNGVTLEIHTSGDSPQQSILAGLEALKKHEEENPH